MHVESGAKQRVRSSKGAMGLMQIMPKTWAELRARYGLGADPFDPRDNILAGAAYIRELHDRYGTPGFLAAYNAGPGRYERHLATGRPLPDETQAYVATLAPMINRVSRRGCPPARRSHATELSRLQPTLDIAYIDDTYPFMLSHERERFIGALRSVALLNE